MKSDENAHSAYYMYEIKKKRQENQYTFYHLRMLNVVFCFSLLTELNQIKMHENTFTD